MRLFRSGPGGDVTPSHTTGDLGDHGRGEVPGWTRRWLALAKYLVAPVIILIMVAILLPVYLQAREPTYTMQCMGNLKQVAAAVGMYETDYQGYPLAPTWHTSLRAYIDNPADPEERVIPGSELDPLTCPSDPTDSTCSYLYLDRGRLGYTKSRLSETVTPLAVDEYFHIKVTLAYYDGHVTKMEKQQWLHERTRQWEIRRDLEHPSWFAYEPMPGSVEGPSGPTPYIDRTRNYIWPEF